MPLYTRMIDKLLFMQFRNATRFTQDSPVYPDVWLEYFRNAKQLSTFRMDLIFTPHKNSSAGELFKVLTESSQFNLSKTEEWQIASSGESVVARLTFYEMITIALPLTAWWQQYMWNKEGTETEEQFWLKELVGAIIYESEGDLEKLNLTINNPDDSAMNVRQILQSRYNDMFPGFPNKGVAGPIVLWAISRNRPAYISLEQSVSTTKADAGRRVFDIDGANISWAIIDTGIDASHPAFRKTDPAKGKPYSTPFGAPEDKVLNRTRIVATYDFSRFREILVSIHRPILSPSGSGTEGMQGEQEPGTHQTISSTSNKYNVSLKPTEIQNFVKEIEKDLKEGRLLDWSIISPLLRIPHNEKEYVKPLHPHGTHVAGILGACMDDKIMGKLMGMCPRIDLIDIRVMDPTGTGQEFNILAALQFLRWANMQKDGMNIHGANLSFSMIHEVASYACGLTPVCVACERLVADGIIVVAAAGNLGQAMYQSSTGAIDQGFRVVNITDPGNAEEVITVGSTHRNRPHSYGVSYFSSKGPTGDGRFKPDLVAPGEKIVSTILNHATDRMDGTSMATPHVSGAAALLLSRNRELIGRPRRVKAILCETATDLGRDRYFQGRGMVDVLRAIQSV